MKHFKLSVIIFLVVFQSCKIQENQQKIKAQQQITIYAIGDSTMANKKNPSENPEHGWVQVLPQFFNSNVSIDNRAVNGRSTRSFIAENKWEAVLKTLKKGDYVLIQFGHNDQKEKDPKRYTNPHTAYRNNLIKFVSETRKKGAIPVLFSSIVRRKFNEYGTLVDTHGVYPLEVRLVANEFNVTFVDLQYLTEQLEESYGVENSKKLHLHFEAGENSYYNEAKHDDTHLSELGATEVSKLVIEAIKKSNLKLKEYIK
ncbi:lysophospholipase L1-like esterase [Lutibacter oceani]|uniref:Lysophospholipase L1-like esterase n=1 Tax=Lutibacter oceani TaxID=1853311 RepID=A0A3D9RWZ8_9FLAO|nr:rhamnogalacturonan acetylesterase [Lutibacter oceani]REE82114.1 lysophospholipase L1-like esterase [Lutibacter oceani]